MITLPHIKMTELGIEPATLEVKGEWLNHLITEASLKKLDFCIMSQFYDFKENFNLQKQTEG